MTATSPAVAMEGARAPGARLRTDPEAAAAAGRSNPARLVERRIDMALAIQDVLLIPYGTADWSFAGLAVEGFTSRTLRLAAAFPCAVIDLRGHEPLRLNNSRYALGFIPDLQGGADPAGIVQDYLKRLCSPWDRLSQRFLDAYFGFLAETIEENREVLRGRLEPYAGLYDYRDWLFSAPKPLPRAHLFAPQIPGSAVIDRANFVPVDFAFWLGCGVRAVVSAQSAPTPRKAKEQGDRLRQAGIEVVTLGPTDLADARRDVFRRILSPTPAFWEGETLPTGPFRPAALDE